MNTSKKTTRLVQLSMLAALIVVLQFLGTLLSGWTGLPMSFVLIPIVVGAIIISPTAGAILGAIFGIMTVAMGLLSLDPFTSILMYNFGVWKMIVVIIICFVKATVAGLGAGYVYKLLNTLFKGKNKTLTTVLSSVSAPIINTGIFVLGMFLFFFNDMDAIQLALAKLSDPEIQSIVAVPAAKYIVLGLAGWNFVSEFAINLIISPAVVKVADIVVNKKK